MTEAEAKRKFEELKHQVLQDGKVDLIEAYVLLDFVNECCKSGKSEFEDLKQLLSRCAKDKVIDIEESKLLAEELDRMSCKLDCKISFEKWLAVLAGLAGLTCISFLVYLMCK